MDILLSPRLGSPLDIIARRGLHGELPVSLPTARHSPSHNGRFDVTLAVTAVATSAGCDGADQGGRGQGAKMSERMTLTGPSVQGDI